MCYNYGRFEYRIHFIEGYSFERQTIFRDSSFLLLQRESRYALRDWLEGQLQSVKNGVYDNVILDSYI